MERLAARYPDDLEAAALYALALLATVPRTVEAAGHAAHADASGSGDVSLAALAGSDVQRRIAAILQRVLAVNPDHPGAAHYLIHVYDDPAHAHLALDVARRYARIAPEASHALHMPAHIFLQLGRWDEAAAADEAALGASDAWVRRRGLPQTMRSYHSLAWLQYSR